MGCFKKQPPPVVLSYDDDNCPYGIKPSELFKINEDKDLEGLRARGGVLGLAKILNTDPHHGLPTAADVPESASIAEHSRVFGPNRFKAVPPKNFFMLCYENLQDPIILLLIAAALVSTVLGAALEEQRKEKEWMEGVAIWVAVFIVVAVGAGNDYQKDLQFRKLNAQKDVIEVKVYRGGEQTLIKNTEIVVGDIMEVDTGDKIIADGIMIDGHHLVVDEASLTGESDPIKKSTEEDPWCRSGTQVSEGSGRLLVVAVGDQSLWGKTMALVSTAGGEDTPLQEKLADMAAAIGKVGLGVAVACFIALLIKWCVENKGFPLSKINDHGPVQFFLYAVTIVVVAVPEGLPLAVTISLAYSMKKMMKDNNFVRVLAACETMGGATAICSDKTGTLTENRMTVTQGWFGGVKYETTPAFSDLPQDLANQLAMNFSLNSKAFLIYKDDTAVDMDAKAALAAQRRVEFVGNRTECALLMLLQKWNMSYQNLREEWEPKVKEVYGFSSAKKMASVLVEMPHGLRLYNKGAAEWVLKRCTRMIVPGGGVAPMTDADRDNLVQVVVGMASKGLRCICLTYTDYPAQDSSRPADFFAEADRVDNNLVCCAIVGIKDPVRQEVPEAVRICQKAGITVRMVTGDNIHTARHIARECGILTDDGVALEGPVFRTMPAHELLPMLPKLQVLARSSPEDKLTLVRFLKEEGEVVAVTGDGTNDAPALKESDVGLAMGIAGTEVAKEAADIVILDDNFSSIVKSVLWGRSVFNSIRKFLQFQLTVNFVALVVAFVGAVAGGRIPLNVLQLLWVNLIMDTMGALALATEDPNPDLLNDKPHGRDESLITGKMWKHILVQGLYQLFWLFFFLYALPLVFPVYRETTYCDMITLGPDENNKAWCTATLQADMGASVTDAQLYCGAMAYCGLPCSPDTRQSPTCPLSVYFPPGQVPSDAAAAFAPSGLSVDTYNKYKAYMDKLHVKDKEKDFQHADSLLFNAFILLQVANEVNARRINDEPNIFQAIHHSPIFLGVILITLALQVIIMQTPVGTFFKVIPLNGAEWGVSFAIGISAMPISILTRLLSKWMPSFSNLRRKRNRRTMSNNSSARHPGTGRRVHSGKVHSEMSLATRSAGNEKTSTAAAPPAFSGGAPVNGSAASTAPTQHIGIGTLQG